MEFTKIVIGAIENVSFPDLQLFSVPAKIDTGADFGCVNARIIEVIKKDNATFVHFYIPTSGTNDANVTHTLPVVQINSVKSSNGVEQNRYIIQTALRLGGAQIQAQIGLADRTSMKYPVLIGKKILAGNFIVDVSREFLASNKD